MNAGAAAAYSRRILADGASSFDHTIDAATVRFHVLRLSLFSIVGSAVTYFAGSADEGFAKLVMFAMLCEICGFATMCGPLGMGHSLWTPLWFRLTTGTIKQPMLPFVGRRRTALDVYIFAMYVGTIALALASPDRATLTLRAKCALALLSALCLLDRTAHTGSMGAYYWPLLACVALPGVGTPASIAALQLTQIAHLFIPGIAKVTSMDT